MPYYVRPIREEDIPQCARVERDAFPTLFPPTSFHRELKNPLAFYLVACRTQDGGDTTPAPDTTNNTTDSGGHARPGLLSRLQLLAPWHSRVRAAPLSGERISGFIGLWYMAGEAHIVTICVDSENRGKGLGELLLLAAIEHAGERGASFMTLEVRASNHVAQNLYKKYGFTERGVRKGYYSDNREDALIMSTDSLVSPGFRERFVTLVQEHEALWGQAARTLR